MYIQSLTVNRASVSNSNEADAFLDDLILQETSNKPTGVSTIAMKTSAELIDEIGDETKLTSVKLQPTLGEKAVARAITKESCQELLKSTVYPSGAFVLSEGVLQQMSLSELRSLALVFTRLVHLENEM